MARTYIATLCKYFHIFKHTNMWCFLFLSHMHTLNPDGTTGGQSSWYTDKLELTLACTFHFQMLRLTLSQICQSLASQFSLQNCSLDNIIWVKYLLCTLIWYCFFSLHAHSTGTPGCGTTDGESIVSLLLYLVLFCSDWLFLHVIVYWIP